MSTSIAAESAASAVIVSFPPGKTLLVSDAKALITATYPKLFSRFNYAFNGHADSASLAEAVDAISSDVLAWLQAMPDNFKTSSHALSRPKFGLIFALKHEGVRASLGEARCVSAIEAVEGAWEDCKKALVPAKDEVVAPLLECEEDLRSRVEELTTKNDMITVALVSLIAKHHDASIATLVETLLKVKA